MTLIIVLVLDTKNDSMYFRAPPGFRTPHSAFPT